MRSEDASKAPRCGGSSLESEKLLRDGRCCDNRSTISVICPSRQAALEAGNERLRLADKFRASPKSDVRRLPEEVLTRPRKFVLMGHERGCTLCMGGSDFISCGEARRSGSPLRLLAELATIFTHMKSYE